MKPSALLIVCGFFVLSLSCRKKPTACINAISGSYQVGDTVRITSCSTDAETYLWRIYSDIDLNDFVDDPFFGNHFVSSGGDGCSAWIEVKFYEAKNYSIYLKNPLLQQGSCGSSSQEWRREDDITTSITIKP